jgi:hypothetical protein
MVGLQRGPVGRGQQPSGVATPQSVCGSTESADGRAVVAVALAPTGNKRRLRRGTVLPLRRGAVLRSESAQGLSSTTVYATL